jgi:hypothetical protein
MFNVKMGDQIITSNLSLAVFDDEFKARDYLERVAENHMEIQPGNVSIAITKQMLNDVDCLYPRSVVMKRYGENERDWFVICLNYEIIKSERSIKYVQHLIVVFTD